eukprot:2273566-Amphidinium_carterae.1
MGLELPVPASGLYSPSDLDQVNISEDAGWMNGEDEFNYESVDSDEAARDERVDQTQAYHRLPGIGG